MDLEVRRRMPAPPAEVYAAWTDPHWMRLWMSVPEGAAKSVELDARPGGAIRIVMVENGRDIEITGAFVELQPPDRLSFIWHPPGAGPRETLVTVTLTAAGDGETDLVLTHTGLPSAESASGHKKGWEVIAGKLAAQFRTAGTLQGGTDA